MATLKQNIEKLKEFQVIAHNPDAKNEWIRNLPASELQELIEFFPDDEPDRPRMIERLSELQKEATAAANLALQTEIRDMTSELKALTVQIKHLTIAAVILGSLAFVCTVEQTYLAFHTSQQTHSAPDKNQK
jgi:hypothetical protein